MRIYNRFSSVDQAQLDFEIAPVELDVDVMAPHIAPPDRVDASVDDRAGETADNGKPIWSVEDIAAHLNRSGASWTEADIGAAQQGDNDPTTIRYGFFEERGELIDNGYAYELNGRLYAFNEYFNFASFTEAQRGAAREAIESWDDLVSLSFVETTAGDADINFGNLASAPTTQAYAYLPRNLLSTNPIVNAQVQELAGDVWVSASQASNFQFDEGRYGLQTLTHEVGHALGLSHPGGYNAAPGVSITYDANAEYYQDTRSYSVMSYFNAREIGARHFDFHMSTIAYSGVPLVHDIAAIQAMYGADMTTRTGDTTYGFNSTAGRDSFDFELTPAPIMAIWDAGGEDTIDASGYDTVQIIDLRGGALSSIGGVTIDSAPSFEEVNANRAAEGLPPVDRATYDANMAALAGNPAVGQLTDNVGIAYGAVIENAIGGSGDDLLIGNDVSNTLLGNAGNDALVGGDGVDTFTGGAGNDTIFVEINTETVSSKRGPVSLDLVTDFVSGSDKLDLSLLDGNTEIDGRQDFVVVDEFTGSAGEIFFNTFGNVNAAEKSLGIDIPGYSGPSKGVGKITVVLGDVDGGGADFAYVLIGTSKFSIDDLLGLEIDEDVLGNAANANADAASAGQSSGSMSADFDSLPDELFSSPNSLDVFEDMLQSLSQPGVDRNFDFHDMSAFDSPRFDNLEVAHIV